MYLTIVYLTSRKDPKFNWFIDSLRRELSSTFYDNIKIVVVDYFLQACDDWTELDVECRRNRWKIDSSLIPDHKIVFTPPKPSVWQGKHRITKQNHFSASNARNTGICYAPSGWICFVDDLSVLMPGWIQGVKAAMHGNYIVCGAYRKVKNLIVEHGLVKSFTNHEAGKDCRWYAGNNGGAVDCHGGWLFGCSLCAPVDAFLGINGYPESLCDAMGYEDCPTGAVLARGGYRFKYDRRMLTFESEEDHYLDRPMLRTDPGISPNDKSHKMLELCKDITKFDNYFGEGFPDLAALRRHIILNGGEFPIRTKPTNEWYTNTPLVDL